MPDPALRAYAEEYGTFVRAIASRGERPARYQAARIERRHADLWAGFALSLGAPVQDAPNLPQVVELLRVTQAAVTTPAGALGACCAFAHVGEGAEVLARLAELPPAERELADATCQALTTALWNALSGLRPPASMN